MAGAPVGNQNATKAKRLLTDALRRELTQNPEDVRLIARKLIESAKAGESWAQTLIHDRVDGKAPQPLTGGDEGDAPIRTVTRIELVDLNERRSDRGPDRTPPEA
jgi:hypothetical protein